MEQTTTTEQWTVSKQVSHQARQPDERTEERLTPLGKTACRDGRGMMNKDSKSTLYAQVQGILWDSKKIHTLD